MEPKVSFENYSLTKEAFFPKKLNFSFLNKTKNVADDVKKEKTIFTHKPEDSTINPEQFNIFSKDQVRNAHNNTIKNEGTGSFLADGVLGLTKRIIPKTKEGIENGVAKVKDTMERADTAVGKHLAGQNPDSFRGKLFSTKTLQQVGEEVHDNGAKSKVMKESRRPSLVAPVENTVKFTSPFLAAAYVGDKLYPQTGQTEPQPTQETEVNKTASVSDDFMNEREVAALDKIASLQKIAELEDGMEKQAKLLAETEQKLFEKTAAYDDLFLQKESLEKTAAETKQQLFEKEASFEELRLRTIAQTRSKVAVDLGEELLETGIIKQAQFNETVDKLMICDESTIKNYENMIKLAKNNDESLESLAVLGEYKSNEKLASSPHQNAAQGLSKSGQTMGEAARDLLK